MISYILKVAFDKIFKSEQVSRHGNQEETFVQAESTPWVTVIGHLFCIAVYREVLRVLFNQVHFWCQKEEKQNKTGYLLKEISNFILFRLRQMGRHNPLQTSQFQLRKRWWRFSNGEQIGQNKRAMDKYEYDIIEWQREYGKLEDQRRD